MVVARSGIRSVDVCLLNMPRLALMVHKSVVITLIASAGSRPLVHLDSKILLLDKSHGMGTTTTTSRRGGRGISTGGDTRRAGGGRVGTPSATSMSYLVCGGHRSMERGEMTHHGLILLLLVSMDRLSMLPEIVQTRKLLSAMTTKGAFAGMFSDVAGKVLTSGKDHTTVAKAPALESFCRGRTVALVDASWLRVHGLGNDHGGHVWRI